ncbi:MAG: hypothetical protein ABID64_05240 [Nitrospirota bacterium]
MAKFSIKKLVVISLFGVFLIGAAGVASAQQALPKGGDSFETAVELEPGVYQADSLEENEYFYVADIKPGQEITVKYTFSAGTGNDGWGILGLYDENKAELFDDWDTVSKGDSGSVIASWMPNTDEDSYKYYIRTGYDDYDVSSVLLDISLTDYYDAGSQTDAGDSFEKAMSLAAGEYEGYLSGELGSDVKDFYEMEIKKGEELTVKVTPPMEANMEVVLYDDSRKELRHEYASNPGAIIETSLVARESEDIFVAVLCDEWCSYDLVNYTLNVTIQPSAEVVGAPVGEEGAPKVILSPSGEGAPIGEAREAGEAGEVEKGIFSGIVLWIAGSIVLLIIIGIIVSSFLKKKE